MKRTIAAALAAVLVGSLTAQAGRAGAIPCAHRRRHRALEAGD
jgi:hypothetical protein